MSVSPLAGILNPGAQEAQGIQQVAQEAQGSAIDQRNYMQAALGQSLGYYAPAANMYNYWFGGGTQNTGAQVPTGYGGAPTGYTPSYPTFPGSVGGASNPNSTPAGAAVNGFFGGALGGSSAAVTGVENVNPALGPITVNGTSPTSLGTVTPGGSGSTMYTGLQPGPSSQTESYGQLPGSLPTPTPAGGSSGPSQNNITYYAPGTTSSTGATGYSTENAALQSVGMGTYQPGPYTMNNPTYYTPGTTTSVGAQGYSSPIGAMAAGGNVAAQNTLAGMNGTAGGQASPSGNLMSPGAGENAFSQYGQAVLSPTQNAQYYNQNAGTLQGQQIAQGAYQQYAPMALGAASQYAGQANAYQQALGQPTASQSYYSGAMGQLSQPNQAAQTYGQTAGQYAAPNPLEQAYGGIMSQYGQTGQQQQFANSGAYQLGQQNQSLSGPGQLEQFAASDASGNNPYFQNLMKQGDAQIAQQQNAAGNYNSGATLAAQALFDQNLLGQQYQQEGQLQGQAQQATQSRLAQQAGNIGAISGLYGSADQQQLQRATDQAQVAGSLSGENLSYLNANNQAAQGVSSANLAQLMGGGNLAQNATSSAYNNLVAGAGLANQTAQNSLSALGLSGNLANQANSQQLAALGLGGNLANQATQTGLAQYNDYLNQALQAQQAEQSRAQLGLSSSLAMGQQEGNLSSTMYNSANQTYAEMIAASLGAQVNAIQVQAQGNQSLQNTGLSLLSTL